jgi:hypothetical protein
MTSTPVTILSKRSGNASDRPSGNILVNGELSINFGAADPGVYFEDSAGNIVKIGPTPYGTTAPNAVPVGLAGNSIGELWTDATAGNPYLKVWTGSAWTKIYAGFSDTAAFATQANSCIIASGAILASGSITANTALLASGAILAGFSDTAAFATQANSCIIASGAITAFATTANTALLASGAILASGSITANTALLASGAILASGVVTSAGTPSVLVLLSGLPSPTSYSSGTLIYQVQSSGTTPSGLFVRALNGWAFT